MASSSKVQFHKDTLLENALRVVDEKIMQAREYLAGLDDDRLEADIIMWRARQEERISDLFRRLGDGGLDNHSLAKWSVEPIPEVDRWDRDKALSRLRRLENQRAEIVAKAESLVTDEQGNLSLTKVQLSEFFGL